MTALGSPSEADDERASAAPPVERESKVCKFTVTMIQFCALKLFNNLAHYLLGENDVETGVKMCFKPSQASLFPCTGASGHFKSKLKDTRAK